MVVVVPCQRVYIYNHYILALSEEDAEIGPPSSELYLCPVEHAFRRNWRTLFPSHSRWRCETFVKVGTLAPPYAPGRQTDTAERAGEEWERGGRVF